MLRTKLKKWIYNIHEHKICIFQGWGYNSLLIKVQNVTSATRNWIPFLGPFSLSVPLESLFRSPAAVCICRGKSRCHRAPSHRHLTIFNMFCLDQ